MSRSRQADIWLVILALLLLTAFVTPSLNADLMWVDEYFSVGNVGGILRVPYNPAQVWESVSQYSPQHVPGYFFLLSGWVALTGWSVFTMRALSLLFALLTVALTYRLGAAWLSARAGAYAALAMSVSTLFIHFAHELRMYTLMALLTVFLLWVYRRVVMANRQPRWWEWAGLFLGALSLIWVHYVSVIVVVAVGLYHLLFVPKNRRWLVVAALLGLACLSFLPWLNYLLVGARFINVEEDTGTAVLGPVGVVRLLLNLFGNGGLALLIVLLATALVAIRRRGGRDVWFFTLAILVLTLVVNAVVPMINENRPRYLIHLWPLLALLVGLGLTVLESRRYTRLALLLLALWLVFGVRQVIDPTLLAETDGPRYTRIMPPLRQIIDTVNRLGDEADIVVGFSREQYLFNEVKFGPVAEYYLRDLRMDNAFITLPDARSPEQIRTDLLGAVGSRLDVWFAWEPAVDAETLTPYRQALAEDYTLCVTPVALPDLHIDHYQLSAFDCLSDARPDTTLAAFAGGIELADLKLAAGEQGPLLAAAGWAVDAAVPPETYSVSLKLWADDMFVAQADYGLRAAGFGWQMAAIPLDNVPPGDYQLTATVYDWRTGAALSGQAGDVTGEIVPLLTVSLPLD
ncbi:MAG: hypothetical protein CL610_01530 [Anaerolineaceae bacterium]|nr:hypothetical protein [Anaerolineaceae bacterium]